VEKRQVEGFEKQNLEIGFTPKLIKMQLANSIPFEYLCLLLVFLEASLNLDKVFYASSISP